MAHTIPVLEKALDLVQVLAEDGVGATSAGLAKRLSIAPSTCYRILQTLVKHDWLRVEESGRFAFSTGLLPLLKPLSDYRLLFDHLREPLEKVVEETGLTAKISVKHGESAVTVYRVESPRGLAPNSKVGAAFPLAYGSSGACLLAGLDDVGVGRILAESPAEVWRLQSPEDVWVRVTEVRKKGTCYDPGQFQTQVHGISAPVFGRDRAVFAAVTVVGWADDFAEKKRTRLRKCMLACAGACSGAIAGKTENL